MSDELREFGLARSPVSPLQLLDMSFEQRGQLTQLLGEVNDGLAVHLGRLPGVVTVELPDRPGIDEKVWRALVLVFQGQGGWRFVTLRTFEGVRHLELSC